MIQKLRFRMTLLVIFVLIAVSAGIVIAIDQVNTRNIYAQVESALDALDTSGGVRPSLPSGRPGEEAPPPKPDGENGNEPPEKPDGEGAAEPSARPDGDSDRRPSDLPEDPGSGEPGRRSSRGSLSGAEVASLSNYYTITLNENGEITEWSSDREDLYDESSMQAFADQVLAGGSDSGRIGTQFYRLSEKNENRLLIVLDARLELAAGERVLMITLLVAGIACVLLSFGAWLLIRRMVRPVDEAFRRQRQFVWDASHELKTPLAVIQANADVLANETGENEYLGFIRSEIRRADSLVRNLLTLARMDQGTVRPDMRPLNLSETVLSVLLPFESTVYEAGKTLESDIAEEVFVQGDEGMMQQLTVILLSNALKYSDEHGTIRIRLTRKGRSCELRVENTGEGIGPEDLTRIFDRFYRTDRSRNSETGGEGLGLAIAKSIVEAHHGRIHAESEPARGAAFIVSLLCEKI